MGGEVPWAARWLVVAVCCGCAADLPVSASPLPSAGLCMTELYYLMNTLESDVE